jgi:Beta-galactosidase trimerisation domain
MGLDLSSHFRRPRIAAGTQRRCGRLRLGRKVREAGGSGGTALDELAAQQDVDGFVHPAGDLVVQDLQGLQGRLLDRVAHGGQGRLWQDVIDLHGAVPVLSFGDGHLAGEAAATAHEHGRGEALYLGTLPDRGTLRRLVARACRHAGLEPRAGLPRGVEAVSRGEYQFLISHLDRAVELDLGVKRLDLLTGGMVGPRAVLAPRDALVLRDARALAADAVPDQGPGPAQQVDPATGQAVR